MKCLYLYNPASGREPPARTDYISRRLSEKYDVEACPTSSAEDLERRAASAEGYDLLAFSGGDGTFHRVLQGLKGKDVQLGYLPRGTTGDIARSLGIPRRTGAALDVILKGRSERVDCMRINHSRYVMYVAAAGEPTRVTYETPHRAKRLLGWFAYAFRCLFKNFRLVPFPAVCTCGETRVRTDSVLAFVMNGRSVAGFPLNRSASMQDGTLEVALVKGERKGLSPYLRLLTLFARGTSSKIKDVELMKGDHVRIETDKTLVWDFDGERGSEGDIEVELLPRSVRIFVPRNKKI